MRRCLLVYLLVTLGACRPFDDALTQALDRLDAGTPDAGTPDAGTPDAGTPDAGTPDAGTPDAGTPDAGTPDAGTPDAGPRCVLGATVTGPSSVSMSSFAGPAVGSILNGYLVAAPRVEGTVALMKFDGVLSSPSDLGCAGACLGAHLPRVISNAGAWSGMTWSATATTLHDVSPGAVPIGGTTSSNSCMSILNGDVLHSPDASVLVTGCTMGFGLQRGVTSVVGSSDSREVRSNRNETEETWLAYSTAMSAHVIRVDPATLQPDNSSAAMLQRLTALALDVAPDGTWFLAGLSSGGGTQVYTGRGDAGAELLMLTTPILPVATLNAPLGLAANDTLTVLAYQSAPQGISLQPWARDGGWLPPIRVSSNGVRPAIAADRTGFLVVWVENDVLQLAPLSCD